MRRPIFWANAGVLAIALAAASPAGAQTHTGIRAGISGSPSQFFFGAHIETSPVADHVTFRPNVEIGVGDGLTLVAANFEFAYWFPEKRQPWRIYAGGGPALVIFSGDGPRREGHDGRLGGGFNIMLGAQHRKGLFTELKIGFADSPEVKATVGYAFK